MTGSPASTPRAASPADPGAPRTVGEQVVLCGPDGAAIGTAAKSTVHTTNTPLHLAFSCYVFDGDGRVLVTRRARNKRTFGGVRTNSCCGHPEPGEPVETAVRRRVRDELGLELGEVDLVLPGFRYRAVAADGVVENELCPVFRARARSTSVTLNPAEVDSAWWLAWSAFTADPEGTDPLSAWGQEQLRELAVLGHEPARWPAADRRGLPAAATR